MHSKNLVLSDPF